MSTARIDAERVTKCGWGVYIDNEATCSINPSPTGANVNSNNCPEYDMEKCSRAWAEHSNCPKLRQQGHYGGSRRR